MKSRVDDLHAQEEQMIVLWIHFVYLKCAENIARSTFIYLFCGSVARITMYLFV